MTWTRGEPLWPKKRSRSAAVVVDTGQAQPRGQSRGNQNMGACRGATAPPPGVPAAAGAAHPGGKEAGRGSLAEVPEGEGPLSRVRRRRLTGEQVRGVVVPGGRRHAG